MLPLIFLFIFATIFGNDEIEERGVKTTTYYVPAIISLAVISATMQSLAINLTQDRERGLLKRVRGTPLPTQVFVAGRVGNSLVVSVLMVVLVAVIGRLVYDVSIPTERLPAVLVALGGRRVLVLLPGLRFDRGDPLRGRRARDLERRRAAALLHLGHLHPRQRDPRGRPQLRRPVPDPPLLRGLLHRLGPQHDAGPASSGPTSRSSPPGGWRGCWWRCSRSAGSRAASNPPLGSRQVDDPLRHPQRLGPGAQRQLL